MNVYVGTSGELKNAYIGEYIEETYTIPSLSNDTNTRQYTYVSIGKTGYSVKEISIEGTGITSNSSYPGDFIMGIRANNGSGNIYGAQLQIGSQLRAKMVYNDGSWHDIRADLSGLNQTTSNSIKFTFDADNGVLKINGTDTVYTTGSTEKTIIQGIFNSSTITGMLSCVRANATATVTVIYTPNS